MISLDGIYYSKYYRIVTHPQNYPGRHQESRGRVYESVKPLDPVAQFHLVIRGLG